MKIAKLLEFTTSKRQGAGAGDFVKRYEKTLDREEKTAANRIKKSKDQMLGAYKHLYEKYPEEFGFMLSKHGLDAKEIFEGTPSEQRTPASETSKNIELTDDVLQYAKTHGITPEQALRIKKQRLGQ